MITSATTTTNFKNWIYNRIWNLLHDTTAFSVYLFRLFRTSASNTITPPLEPSWTQSWPLIVLYKFRSSQEIRKLCKVIAICDISESDIQKKLAHFKLLLFSVHDKISQWFQQIYCFYSFLIKFLIVSTVICIMVLITTQNDFLLFLLKTIGQNNR